MMKQRSFPGMKMMESQFAPQGRMGGVKSPGEPNCVGATQQKYALLDINETRVRGHASNPMA